MKQRAGNDPDPASLISCGSDDLFDGGYIGPPPQQRKGYCTTPKVSPGAGRQDTRASLPSRTPGLLAQRRFDHPDRPRHGLFDA